MCKQNIIPLGDNNANDAYVEKFAHNSFSQIKIRRLR